MNTALSVGRRWLATPIVPSPDPTRATAECTVCPSICLGDTPLQAERTLTRHIKICHPDLS